MSLESIDMMIRFDEGVLGEVIGILMDQNHSADYMVNLFLVGLYQLPETHLPAQRVLYEIEDFLITGFHES